MKKRRKSLHHRKPKSLGGDHSKENTILLEVEEHRAWHLLFGNMSAEQICDLINQKYLDPEYLFVCYNRGVIRRVQLSNQYGDV